MSGSNGGCILRQDHGIWGRHGAKRTRLMSGSNGGCILRQDNGIWGRHGAKRTRLMDEREAAAGVCEEVGGSIKHPIFIYRVMGIHIKCTS